MVGVARSLACRNCKRKKKGCDLNRPSCAQCTRLGLTCGYDEKRWTFINNSDLEGCAGHPHPPYFRHSKPIELDFAQTLTVTPLPRDLRRSALATQLEDTFWAVYLPRDDFLQCRYIGGVTDAPWVPAIRLIARQDKLARSAVDALALTALGSLNDDPSLTHEGAKIYANVLHDLNRALKDPVRAQSDGVVAACGMLSTYEIFRKDRSSSVSSQGTDWKRHIAGACQIVHLRGSRRHAGKTGHALFLHARKLAILSGLCNKKPTSLFETDEWRSVPWQNTTKTLRDELWDIMALVPALLQQQDIFFRKIAGWDTGDCSELVSEGRLVLESCIQVAHLFKAWEDRTLALAKESDTRYVRSDSPFDLDFDTTPLDPRFFDLSNASMSTSDPTSLFDVSSFLPTPEFNHPSPPYTHSASSTSFLQASSPYIGPTTPRSPHHSTTSDIPRSTLSDISRSHGYSFFQTTCQYWYSTLPFYARTHLLYKSLVRKIYSLSPSSTSTSLSDPTTLVDTLPPLPPFTAPSLSASSLSTAFPHYFSPDAGLWGVAHATLSCTMLLLYYSAFDLQDSPECLRVKHLLRTDKRAKMTGEFVGSNLADISSGGKGDGCDRARLKDVAVAWFEGRTNGQKGVDLADGLSLPVFDVERPEENVGMDFDIGHVFGQQGELDRMAMGGMFDEQQQGALEFAY